MDEDAWRIGVGLFAVAGTSVFLWSARWFIRRGEAVPPELKRLFLLYALTNLAGGWLALILGLLALVNPSPGPGRWILLVILAPAFVLLPLTLVDYFRVRNHPRLREFLPRSWTGSEDDRQS
jgi:hypothetical protein